MKKGLKQWTWIWLKKLWIFTTTIWTIDDSSLQKEQKNITGKQDAIDLYDEGKISTTQDHIPICVVGMWGNRWITILHIPSCDGEFLNDEHEDSIRNNLIEENDKKDNDEVIEISIYTEDEDIIHRYITENETE